MKALNELLRLGEQTAAGWLARDSTNFSTGLTSDCPPVGIVKITRSGGVK